MLGILCALVTLYWIVLLVRIILSWVGQVPEPIQPIANAVRALTDPVLRPFRGLLPPVRIGAVGLDLSPIIVFFIVAIIRNLLC